MKLTRSGRTVTRPAKFAVSVGEKPGKEAFLVVAGGEVVEEAVDSPASPAGYSEEGFGRTIVYQGAEEGAGEGQNGLTEFSIADIPIDVIEDRGEEDEDEEEDKGVKTEDGFGDEVDEEEEEVEAEVDDRRRWINDHVISIEEDGQITIEQVGQAGLAHTAPAFPEWWARLSATFLSGLSSGHLVDLWLLCRDGEAVPAHQLLLAHASPALCAWLAGARGEEGSLTLSLPDWDSATVGQFVSCLYQGCLPADLKERGRVRELAGELGLPLGEEAASRLQETQERAVKQEQKPALAAGPGQLGSQQVQVVQTDSGEILLVTCEPGQGGIKGQADTTQLSAAQEIIKIAGGYDAEVERVKAVKIAQIKEQQGKQCPLCYSTAIQHRFTSDAGQLEQKFAYRCCNADCGTDNLKTARAFNQHMTGRHGDSVQYEPASRVCPLCFRPRIEHKNRCLSEEEKGNHRGNLYKCCHCAASKLSAKKFFTHLENHVTKKHVCPKCGKGYSYKHLLNEHTWKEHGEGQHIRFPCNWEGCDYSAKYKQTLHTHVMERHHGVKRKHRQEDAYKQVECPTCQKTLKKWYYHQFHKKTCSSGNVIYQCEICGKEGFINAVTLQNHVRTKHSADRPFSCEYCPSKYATAMSLSGHRSRKHGVNSKGEVVPKKMFPCDHCGKLLTSKMKLQAHIEVIHEGRRDYKCKFCDKTFTSKSNLQIHEGSLHTGVLPYRCDFCQKMFARRSQLTSHRESQHPGHAGPFFVVEDVDTVQVEDIIIPVEEVGDEGVEISVGVEGIMEDVTIT